MLSYCLTFSLLLTCFSRPDFTVTVALRRKQEGLNHVLENLGLAMIIHLRFVAIVCVPLSLAAYPFESTRQARRDCCLCHNLAHRLSTPACFLQALGEDVVRATALLGHRMNQAIWRNPQQLGTALAVRHLIRRR